MELKRGQVVMSCAGRDKGSLLAVTATDGKYAFVCDGKERPLERPKRKNLSHLEATDMFIGDNSMATNRMLKKTLRAMSGKQI